jgi:hypothetical protein
MLFGESDHALREASPQTGATRPSPRQRPRIVWATGQSDPARRAGHADPDARRPAVSLAGEEAGRMRAGENDSGGCGRDRACVERGETRRLMGLLS